MKKHGNTESEIEISQPFSSLVCNPPGCLSPTDVSPLPGNISEKAGSIVSFVISFQFLML
jgi:hypothetical protein